MATTHDIKNVLVFPCGSEIGLEIHRAVKYSRHIRLFGASSVDDHGKFVYKNYTGGLPFVDEKQFILRLNQLVNKNKIDFIYPAHDSVILKLAENRDKIHGKVIGSPPETGMICRYKSSTYEKFRPILKVPQTFRRVDEITSYPVFLKPDAGQGSRGTCLAKSKEEAMLYLSKDPSLLILEYLPGKEYTIDCFTDRNGVLHFCGARERKRVMNGISVNTYPSGTTKEFADIAATINEHLKLRGAWFFQLKRNNKGELALLEIAPRIAGAMALYRNLGINFPLMSIWDAMGYEVSVLPNRFDIELDRALENRFILNIRYKHVYVDLDDCLLIRGKVNTALVAFLYQCINRKIRLHLLSRHTKDIDKTLSKHKLAGIFDTIHRIERKALKSNSIRHKESIFIDDSFAERQSVQRAIGIPVFAPDAVEALLDLAE